jgi:hypothetical protein
VLGAPVKCTYFYLYVLLDLFSRFVAGALIAERENARLAEHLIEEGCARQNIPGPTAAALESGRTDTCTCATR